MWMEMGLSMRLKCLVQRWYGLKKIVVCGTISAVESFFLLQL